MNSHRFLSIGLVLMGLVLLGTGVLGYAMRADGPGVTIDEPEREFATWEAGQTRSVVFRIHNPTRRAIHVVGLAEC